MILYISSIIIFVFVCFNLFWRCHCPLWFKICASLLLLIISQKYVIYNVIGGAFFAPHMPRSAIICLEALYGGFILLFLLLLIWDLYLAGNWLLARIDIPVPRHLPCCLIRCLLCVMALALGAFGTWNAVKVPGVRQQEIKIAALPKQFDGFRIAQLSDLHIGPILNQAWLAEVVQKTNSLKPDLIALTGDYVDGHVDEIGGELAPLAQLEAPFGVFAVTGNHEYYWNAAEWSRVIKELGLKLLDNEHAPLNINGHTLVVAGIPDLAAPRFGFKGPDPAKALAGAPKALTVLLSHQPRLFTETAPLIDLQLSGHTHGGIMFFLQPLIARFNNGFAAGLYQDKGKYLYLNSGTGLWNGFSCRIGVPAEITLITLRSNAD